MSKLDIIKDMLKKPPYTKWEKLLHYINSRPVGTIIARKDLLKELDENHRTFNTIDTYKGILLRLDILAWHSIGEYKILCHVRSNLSQTEAKKAAYSDTSWRKWFNDFKV